MRENYFTWQVGDYRKMWGKKCVYQLVCLSKFFSKKMPEGLMPFSSLLVSCNFSFHLYLFRKWWPFIFNFKRHILNLALSLSKNYTESAQLTLMRETLTQKLLASYSYPFIIMFVFMVQKMSNAKFTAVADRDSLPSAKQFRWVLKSSWSHGIQRKFHLTPSSND